MGIFLWFRFYSSPDKPYQALFRNLAYLYGWPYILPPLFILIFDHGANCNVHLLVLFGSYLKRILMIHLHNSHEGDFISSISRGLQEWGGCRIQTVLVIPIQLFFLTIFVFSFFHLKWHIKVRRLFNAKAIFLEEQMCYYLTHSWEDKRVHTFITVIVGN